MEFMNCSTCADKRMVRVWIQVFGSPQQAYSHGDGPEILSALGQGPGIMKFEVCYGCGSMRPCEEFTEEEDAAIKELSKTQQERSKVGETIGKLLGGTVKPKA